MQAMDDILGHDYAKQVLRSALSSGRMHHAWIFHGPTGVGKLTTALAVARELLGASREDHPDLHLIYKELAGVSDFRHLRERKQMNIPVDLLRERMLGGYVQETYIDPAVGRKPMLNHGKAFIIDEADLLDATGQNALLKTLEEPPPGTYIFLITSNEDRLLPTIRSRCQRVPFGRLDDASVATWVRGYLPDAVRRLDEKIAALTGEKKLSEERQERLGRLQSRRPLLADSGGVSRSVQRFASGSLGRAAVMIDYGLFDWPRQVEPLLASWASGKSQVHAGPLMAELIDAYALDWVDEHRGASKEAANKAGVRQMLVLIAEVCRLRLREVTINPDDPIPADLAAQPWLVGIDLVQDAERNLESNVNVGLLLENLCIQWAAEARGLRLVA